MTQISTLFGISPSSSSRRGPIAGLASPSMMVGMEFELEEVGRGPEGSGEVPSGYDVHSDGSLRNGVEYVFAGGSSGEQIIHRIASMTNFLEGREFSTSERTSTHIHLNMRDNAATAEVVRRMFGLVYLIEPAIFRFADENRKWCGYCQPLTDMPQQRLGDIISGDDTSLRVGAQGQQHNDKYFGFNLKSLSRHGTVEFRYFPGWSGGEDALAWVNLVMEVRLAAMHFDDLSGLLAAASSASDFRAVLAEAMPLSYSRLASLVEDSEIERRANYLSALRSVHTIQPPSIPNRMASVVADSSMAALLDSLLNMRISENGRAVSTLSDIVSSGALTPDLLEDLRSVMRSSSSSEFIRMFEEAVRAAQD